MPLAPQNLKKAEKKKSGWGFFGRKKTARDLREEPRAVAAPARAAAPQQEEQPAPPSGEDLFPEHNRDEQFEIPAFLRASPAEGSQGAARSAVALRRVAFAANKKAGAALSLHRLATSWRAALGELSSHATVGWTARSQTLPAGRQALGLSAATTSLL